MKIVTKLFFGMSALVCVAFTACTSLTSTASTNEIKSEQMVLNTFLDREDYTVIGTATGSSEFVYWDANSRKFVGDTEKYGYVYEPNEPFLGQSDNGQKMFVGVGRRRVKNDEQGAYLLAKLNANYNMIEEAYKLGGDSIFEPIYTVETTTETTGSTVTKKQYKVTVRAKVIQIKMK